MSTELDNANDTDDGAECGTAAPGREPGAECGTAAPGREPAPECGTALGREGDVAHAAPVHRTVIRPVSGWRLVNIRELWQYRELLYFLTWRDVKVRYKQTVLGAAWAILQPAMMMVVFSIFFGRMAHVNTGGLPYPLFVFCGLLPWTFFATAIANSGNSVVGSERLITKIYFPRLAIPFASVGAALVDFAVACSMLFVLMLWYRVTPTWNLLLIPPLVALFTLAALGVGTLLAALNVAYRDFRYVIPFLVQLWMFATPTVYMQPGEDASGVRRQASREGSGFPGAPGFRAAKSRRAGVQGSATVGNPGEREASVSRLDKSPKSSSLSLRERAGVRAAETDISPASVGNGPSRRAGIPSGGAKAEGKCQTAESETKTQDLSPKTQDLRPGSEGAVPNNIQALLNLNPLTGLVAAFRSAVVGDPVPWRMLGWSTAGVVISFIVGCLYFRKVEDSFADII